MDKTRKNPTIDLHDPYLVRDMANLILEIGDFTDGYLPEGWRFELTRSTGMAGEDLGNFTGVIERALDIKERLIALGVSEVLRSARAGEQLDTHTLGAQQEVEQ